MGNRRTSKRALARERSGKRLPGGIGTVPDYEELTMVFKCAVCGIEKEHTEFNRQANNHRGYRYDCRSCQHEAGAQYRERVRNGIRSRGRGRPRREVKPEVKIATPTIQDQIPASARVVLERMLAGGLAGDKRTFVTEDRRATKPSASSNCPRGARRSRLVSSSHKPRRLAVAWRRCCCGRWLGIRSTCSGTR